MTEHIMARLSDLDDFEADIAAVAADVATVIADLAAHLADTSGAHAATAISSTPAGGLAATTVQAALNELDTEKLAAASYTAADVLAKLLTVDGSGSGLDADLLDGNSSAFYSPASVSGTAAAILASLLTVDGAGSGLDADLLDGNSSAFYSPASVSGTAAAILASLLTVDGTGSGLDADTVDGSHASAFAAASHTHVAADVTDFTEAVQDVIGALLTGSEGTGDLDWTYTDGSNTLTAVVKDNAIGPDELANTAVTPGSYTLSSITVDEQGRITAASNGAASSALPMWYLSKLTVSNDAGDLTNDIGIAVGAARDSTNTVDIYINSALIKRLDANWAAGTNQGMRNSAAAITDTTYHIYAAAKAGGADADIYAHTSTTIATVLAALQAESGGSSYLYLRRIFSIRRVSGAIVAFVQDGDLVQWTTVPALDIDAANPGTSAVLRTLSVPAGIKVEALYNFTITSSGSAFPLCYFSDPDVTDQAPDLAATPLGSLRANATSTLMAQGGRTRTNTSSQIRSRVHQSDASVELQIATLGYIDRRDRG